jgi:curli biogenesis system outer membrane secretion channel CsgG
MSIRVWAKWAVCVAFLVSGPLAHAAGEPETKVEKCGKSYGTLAVAEPKAGWGHIQRFGLGSPTALIRMLIQQSGCFDVVERGAAMQNLQQERALVQSGDARQDSNLGMGQMQAADFVMTADVQIPTSTTGGVGGGGLLGGKLGVLSAIAGSLKFKEAMTSLLVSDVRSGIQVAAAEGRASKTEFSLAGFGAAGGALGALGGYTSTPEGKMVASSLLDNYNKVVLAIRDQAQLIKPTSAAADANAAASTRAEAPQQAGQMLAAKIANVKLYAEPSRDSAQVASLQRSDELVASGEVKNGFVYVDGANFSGWVQRTLVAPVGAAPAAAPVAAAPTLAPAPAVPQPAAMTPLSVRPIGALAYAGSFAGADNGNFQILVNGAGQVTGTGDSSNLGLFAMSGRFDPSGAVALVGHMSIGLAVFNGWIEPSTGQVSGTWRYANRIGGGGFGAQRQP